MATTLRRIALTLTLGSILMVTASNAHGQNKDQYVGAATYSGALGQLQKMGDGAVHTGVGFDGRQRIPIASPTPVGPHSGSDVFVKPCVTPKPQPRPVPSPVPNPTPRPTPRPTPVPPAPPVKKTK